MYPSLSNFTGGGPQRGGAGGAAAGSGAAGRPPAPALQSVDASPWSADSHSVLRVKIADEYRLDPLVTVPPALEASSRPQRDFDFDYERTVMQQEGSSLVDRFLAKPEESYHAGTKAGKYVAMGYAPAAVHLALAYQAQSRGDDAAAVDFCNNYTQLLGMGFAPELAAGALVRAKNDAAAAADICLAAAS
ncbi:MAG: hypothetical protein J3K34DRAFT_430993 [Monoraphidium minutum]|nr:MAG: hypothetical protein J3K34DRAFT_430993 [Monoraphidium minutum]